MLNNKTRTVSIMLLVLVCVLTLDFAAFGQKKKNNADSSRKEEYNQIESADKV